MSTEYDTEVQGHSDRLDFVSAYDRSVNFAREYNIHRNRG